MSQEQTEKGMECRRVLRAVRRWYRPGHAPRMILTLTIIACSVMLSAPTYASCKNTPTPKLPVGFAEPHTLQAQAFVQQAFPSIEEDEDDDASIVGLWHVLFVSGGQVFDEGYDQWHSDGTEILNDTAPPQPANGAGTICLGVYKKTGPRTYKLKHPFWSFDATGTLVGTGVILETVTVEREGNHYTGSFEFITYDLKANITSDTTGELKAERITVD
jgi:hypothetical protein